MYKLERLSHTFVGDYADCGEKARLRRLERVPEHPSWALLGGRAVHAATETLDLQDFGIVFDGPDSFLEAFEIEVENARDSSGIPMEEWTASGPRNAKEDGKWWINNGPVFVENWRRFLYGSPFQVAISPDGEPAIELELTGELGGAPFKGFIDRILEDSRNGQLWVFDLKTGKRAQKPKQLHTYRIILDQIFKGKWSPRYGSYYMNRTGMMSDPIDFSILDSKFIELEYEMTRRGVEAGVFLPNTTSGWCDSCSVRKYCWAVNGEEAASVSPIERVSE